MGCKLLSKEYITIPMCELKRGEIAEIMEGGNQGEIVTRFCDRIYILGNKTGAGYDDKKTLRVRILQPGEKIIITKEIEDFL